MYCKLPTNGKQLPAFPLTAMTGIEPRPQRWEARVLPLLNLVPSRKHTTHNHQELKAVFLPLKEFQDLCSKTLQWLSISTKKGGVKSGFMENPNLLYQETGSSQSSTHPRLGKCDSRQTIQTRPDHSNRMVPSPRGLPSHMLPVTPAQSGPVCYQVQQQITTVCVTGSRLPGLCSRYTQSVLGRSGPICLPTSSHLG